MSHDRFSQRDRCGDRNQDRFSSCSSWQERESNYRFHDEIERTSNRVSCGNVFGGRGLNNFSLNIGGRGFNIGIGNGFNPWGGGCYPQNSWNNRYNPWGGGYNRYQNGDILQNLAVIGINAALRNRGLDQCNRYNPYDRRDPYDRYNPYDRRDPYDRYNPYDRHNPYDRRDPYNRYNPYDRHNPYDRRDPYNRYNPYDTRDPYNRYNPYDTRDPYNRYEPYDLRQRYRPYEPIEQCSPYRHRDVDPYQDRIYTPSLPHDQRRPCDTRYQFQRDRDGRLPYFDPNDPSNRHRYNYRQNEGGRIIITPPFTEDYQNLRRYLEERRRQSVWGR